MISYRCCRLCLNVQEIASAFEAFGLHRQERIYRSLSTTIWIAADSQSASEVIIKLRDFIQVANMWLLQYLLDGICSSQSIDSIRPHLYFTVVFGIVLYDASLADTCSEYVGQPCIQTKNVISCDLLLW